MHIDYLGNYVHLPPYLVPSSFLRSVLVFHMCLINAKDGHLIKINHQKNFVLLAWLAVHSLRIIQGKSVSFDRLIWSPRHTWKKWFPRRIPYHIDIRVPPPNTHPYGEITQMMERNTTRFIWVPASSWLSLGYWVHTCFKRVTVSFSSPNSLLRVQRHIHNNILI